MNFEEEIRSIQDRNSRVEKDKAWETSPTRIGLIMGITYLVAGITLVSVHANTPWLTALVPTLGFVLSTLTVSPVKNWWMKRDKK